MNPPPLIVIFGAAVRPDGQASAALVRRTGYGLTAARAYPDAPLLCSGAAVRGGPSEASLIAGGLLEAGVAAERLILDEASRTTLENVEAAVRTLQAGGYPRVVACSDAYHLPRIQLLLRLHGVACEPWAGAGGPPLGHGLGMGLREALAIPHNLARVLARAPRLRS